MLPHLLRWYLYAEAVILFPSAAAPASAAVASPTRRMLGHKPSTPSSFLSMSGDLLGDNEVLPGTMEAEVKHFLTAGADWIFHASSPRVGSPLSIPIRAGVLPATFLSKTQKFLMRDAVTMASMYPPCYLSSVRKS